MIKNLVKIKVEGKSTFPLNILAKRGLRLKKVKFGKNDVVFHTDGKTLEKCVNVLEETNRKYEIISKKGLGFFFQRATKRVGIIAGIVMSIIAFIIYSSSILTVNISGNLLVDTETIQKKVDETIKVPVFNRKFDKKRLESEIINIDGISSASVEKRGTSINVVVLEELPLTEIEDIKLRESPIVAEYDSVITRIITISGTPLVKEGQAVKKGQELIAPYLIADENTVVYGKAGGEVYGRVWITKTKTYNNQTLSYERTGRKHTVYDIKLFDWIRKKNSGIPFDNYETEIETVYLGGAVPIKATKYVYYETEEVYSDFDFDLHSEAIIKQLMTEMEEELPVDAKKLRNWYVTKRLDKIVKIDIYYEVETSIT